MEIEYRTKKLTERIKLVNTSCGGSMGMMDKENVGVRVLTKDDGSVMYTAFVIFGNKCYCNSKTVKGGVFVENDGHKNASSEILKDKNICEYDCVAEWNRTNGTNVNQ